MEDREKLSLLLWALLANLKIPENAQMIPPLNEATGSILMRLMYRQDMIQ